MDDLLPYYEQELGFLRRYSKEFADKYPKVAGRLMMSGEVSEDPHIERMIQSFALLSARVSKRLDDDYPQFTESLFEVLYPHYLKPFPSCSIAKLDSGLSSTQLTGTNVIPRGTAFKSKMIKGVACKFKSVYDVAISPVALSSATFDVVANAPDAVVLPAKTSSVLHITLNVNSQQTTLKKLNLDQLRVFIDGEFSFCAALRDALFMRSLKAYVEFGDNGRWLPLETVPFKEVGYSEEDALIDYDSRSHPAYRLLTEYFAYPEKFNFFDLDLSEINKNLAKTDKKITLHFAMSGMRSDSNVSRMLSTLSANNMLLGCTPVINLFKQHGEPIRVTHTKNRYPVLADARQAFAYEIHSIDAVKLIRQTPQGESVTEFKPFYSLRHKDTAEESGHYWVAHRDELVGMKSPGYETEISIVDDDFDPAKVETQTLSLNLTCSNRDLPSKLSYGLAGGDLFMEGGSVVKTISFLRKPTNAHRFERGRGIQWRLISHLSMNHLSLAGGGLEAFQEILSLYDLPRSPISQRQISGITGFEGKPSQAWLSGNPYACMVRGTEITMTIDEESFVGSGIHVFAHITDHFLGLYANANSYTQLVIVSQKTGEELLRCSPRSGNLNLV